MKKESVKPRKWLQFCTELLRKVLELKLFEAIRNDSVNQYETVNWVWSGVTSDFTMLIIADEWFTFKILSTSIFCQSYKVNLTCFSPDEKLILVVFWHSPKLKLLEYFCQIEQSFDGKFWSGRCAGLEEGKSGKNT